MARSLLRPQAFAVRNGPKASTAIGGLSMQPIQRTRSPAFRLCRGLALAAVALTAVFLFVTAAIPLRAQASGPSMVVPNPNMRTAASGFVTPPGLAFLPDGRVLVVGSQCLNQGCYGLGDDYADQQSAEVYR